MAKSPSLAPYSPALVSFFVVLVLIFLGCCLLLLTGCQTVGNRSKFTPTTTELVGGQAVTVNIQDDTRIGTASGTSSTGWIAADVDGTTAMFANSPPRNISLVWAADGTRQLNLAGPSDATLEGLEYNPTTGVIKIARFTTLTSTVVSAFDPSVEAVTSWWKELTPAQRDARLAELQTRAALGDSLASTILSVVTGIPVP
ncbi:MAG: hypothetical protein ACK5U7_07595 [Bacteroidota bacterium]|jgi:hypothetical protein